MIVRAEASTLLREAGSAPTQIAMAAISGFARGLFFLNEPEDGGEADPGQPHGLTPLQWRWDLDDVAPAGMQGGRTRTRGTSNLDAQRRRCVHGAVEPPGDGC